MSLFDRFNLIKESIKSSFRVNFWEWKNNENSAWKFLGFENFTLIFIDKNGVIFRYGDGL